MVFCGFFITFVVENQSVMLFQEQKLILSEYTGLYDLVVPKDHLLRRINDLVDFSFVHKELMGKYCLTNGRGAEPPIRMFKYLLLKTIYDISDVDVVERSLYDMSFKYFLGMAPEEDVIDASSLCRFRRQRLKDMDLLNLLIGKTVEIAVAKGVLRSRTIIVDSTHTLSRSNPCSPIEILRMRSKQLRKALFNADEEIRPSLPEKNVEDDLSKELDYTKSLLDVVISKDCLANVPAVRERLNMLKETLSDIEDHYTTSIDTDARIGHKSEDSSFFGYKTNIAMSDERIITAATITSGEKPDGRELGSLIEQSRKNGMKVDTVIGDTAYSGSDNLKLAEDEEMGFELVAKLNPIISQGARKEEDKFEFNKDAGMFVCPAGHMATRKAIQGKKHGRQNQTTTYYFDIGKCKTCSRRNGCYKDGAKSKTYSVPIKTGEQKRQIAFQQTKEFKEKARKRYKIEAKNSELKHVYGYDRAKSYGIDCMRMQGAVTIFVANIKRIIKLL